MTASCVLLACRHRRSWPAGTRRHSIKRLRCGTAGMSYIAMVQGTPHVSDRPGVQLLGPAGLLQSCMYKACHWRPHLWVVSHPRATHEPRGSAGDGSSPPLGVRREGLCIVQWSTCYFTYCRQYLAAMLGTPSGHPDCCPRCQACPQCFFL